MVCTISLYKTHFKYIMDISGLQMLLCSQLSFSTNKKIGGTFQNRRFSYVRQYMLISAALTFRETFQLKPWHIFHYKYQIKSLVVLLHYDFPKGTYIQHCSRPCTFIKFILKNISGKKWLALRHLHNKPIRQILHSISTA